MNLNQALDQSNIQMPTGPVWIIPARNFLDAGEDGDHSADHSSFLLQAAGGILAMGGVVAAAGRAQTMSKPLSVHGPFMVSAQSLLAEQKPTTTTTSSNSCSNHPYHHDNTATTENNKRSANTTPVPQEFDFDDENSTTASSMITTATTNTTKEEDDNDNGMLLVSANNQQQPQEASPGNCDEDASLLLRDNDIVCARDKRYLKHAGNVLFAKVIQSVVASFRQAETKRERMTIIESTVVTLQTVHECRFVKKYDKASASWVESSRADVRAKVGHAIRHAIKRSNRGGGGGAAAAARSAAATSPC